MGQRVRYRWLAALLAGLGLTAAVMVASASVTAPQDNWLHYRKQLSGLESFAAYPSIAAGENALVAALWTEGTVVVSRHLGPLQLRWISNDTGAQWKPFTVDGNDVVESALAVSGSTAHVAWIQSAAPNVCYTSCDLSTSAVPPCPAGCDENLSAEVGGADERSQVDLVLDENGGVHVVWVEGESGGIYYKRKPAAGSWEPASIVAGSAGTESDYPALAAASGQVHVVWARWLGYNPDYSVVRYCRHSQPAEPVAETDWSCSPEWEWIEHPARNLSIAADATGNVYVAWDYLKDDLLPVEGRYNYLVGYKHCDGGSNPCEWKPTRTYTRGIQTGITPGAGGEIFKSGEEDSGNNVPEYTHFLRPHISLAASGTVTVPVLTWHARLKVGETTRYKVLWTYATAPGSDANGNLSWTPSGYMTLSTNLQGDLDMNVDSATAMLAIVGDLKDVKDGGDPERDGHLHVVYHEGDALPGSDPWAVIYNSNEPFLSGDNPRVYLPIVAQNATGGGSGGE